MNVLIACKRPEKTKKLRQYLLQYDASINIVGEPATVKSAISCLQNKEDEIDLAILDSTLSGGCVADFYSQIEFNNPVVFSSQDKSDAYDAIKSNCLDFLLEPLDYGDIERLLDSMNQLQTLKTSSLPNAPQRFKKRFIVKFGDKIRYVKADEISCVYAEGKLVYICTKSTGRKFIIEHTLDELEKTHLNPEDFYRINRKFIVNIDSIEEVRNYANSRLKLILNPSTDHDMIVSREKVNDFKSWLNL